MRDCITGHLGNRVTDCGGGVPSKHLAQLHVVALSDLGRQICAALRCMRRRAAQERGHAQRDANLRCRMFCGHALAGRHASAFET